MSYLGPTRLQFAGQFQAAPSTVNNDPVHYDNATFKKNYQEYGPGATNGWWNPMGDASFRLINCPVTSLMIDGRDEATPNLLVGGSDSRVNGKIVDLDPEQQLVSEIWGQEIRITTAEGVNLLKGTFKVAPFTNIWWSRILGSGGDIAASAVYQSVIENLEWGDPSNPEFQSLNALKTALGDRLSIRFMVESYNMDHTSPEFTRGRISGSIGPAADDEPAHFTVGRHFFPQFNPGGQSVDPLYFACGKVYEKEKLFVLDLGNALPLAKSYGPISSVGPLYLAYLNTSGEVSIVAPVPYGTEDGWYEKTSGIINIPLTAGQCEEIKDVPLMLVGNQKPDPADNPSKLSETPGGYHVRADLFVGRISSEDLPEADRFEPKSSPANEATFNLHASQFGQPLPSSKIFLTFDSSGLQLFTGVDNRTPPVVAKPESALSFPDVVTTDARGIATVTIVGSDPGNVREYMHSQLYGIRYHLAQLMSLDYQFANNVNPSDFISLLLWEPFRGGADWDSIKPIMQQYANLYPLMDQFIDLSSEADLLRHRDSLLLVFGLDPKDPNYMPVTRDLSPAKRKAILDWLKSANPTSETPSTKPKGAGVPKASPPSPPAGEPLRGGKTMAAARQISKLRHQTKNY